MSMTRLETFVNLGYHKDPLKGHLYETGDMVRTRRILTMAVESRAMEAALFAASLAVTLEEAQADAGYEGTLEADLSTRQKSLIADLAAKALITPAMSKYKTSLDKAEGDDAGKVEFADKLQFLREMKKTLETSITERRAALSSAADTGVAMIIVTED